MVGVGVVGVPHLRRQGVVDQDVRTSGVGAEGPDGPSGKQIPVVLGLEELTKLFPAVAKTRMQSRIGGC